jgi:hypothetical protein
MNKLGAADKLLKSAHDSLLQDLNNKIASLGQQQRLLTERLLELNRKKHDINQANGNLDVTDVDLVEINAGGKLIVAKRSTLTQIPGSRMEALFSGRWDKKLMRDSYGRSFLTLILFAFRPL